MSRGSVSTPLTPAEAQHAWDTLVALPLVTHEQRDHALEVLARDPAALPVDSPFCDLFLSGPELAALQVLITWLRANDRAGRLRDLPLYPVVAEAIISRLGPISWRDMLDPACLREAGGGGILPIHPRTEAPALRRLIDAALRLPLQPCAAWPAAERRRLISLLQDIVCWLESMDAVYGEPRRDSSAVLSQAAAVPVRHA